MKLDVRSKVLLVLFANLAFLFRVSGWLELMIVSGLAMLLYFAGKGKIALYSLLAFVLFWTLDAYLTDFFSFQLIRNFVTLLTAVRFMLPSFMAGSLLLTTATAYDLVHGLRKWHLPESFLLTLGVMMRFLPAIPADAKTIHRSLRLRGIFLRKRDFIFRPVTYFEYLLVPLLMSLMRTVQALTIASLTKGIALGKRPTETFSSTFNLADWSTCAWMFIMTLWMIRG